LATHRGELCVQDSFGPLAVLQFLLKKCFDPTQNLELTPKIGKVSLPLPQISLSTKKKIRRKFSEFILV
jgi:hypothetical protein